MLKNMIFLLRFRIRKKIEIYVIKSLCVYVQELQVFVNNSDEYIMGNLKLSKF